MCVCLYLSVSVCMLVHVSVCVCMFMCLYLCVYVHVSVPVSLGIEPRVLHICGKYITTEIYVPNPSIINIIITIIIWFVRQDLAV